MKQKTQPSDGVGLNSIADPREISEEVLEEIELDLSVRISQAYSTVMVGRLAEGYDAMTCSINLTSGCVEICHFVGNAHLQVNIPLNPDNAECLGLAMVEKAQLLRQHAAAGPRSK